MTVLRSGSATDVGRVRNDNQDLALEEPNLFAVADGMGGHVGGEVAARVAVKALAASFAAQPTLAGLEQAVTQANVAVFEESLTHPELRGMGTTLTAAAIVAGPNGSDTVLLANVGDSRAYLYSEGRILQLTDDHSLAEEKVRLGELTQAQAAVHPHRHILTRVLGVAEDVAVDLWQLQLRQGDRLLLCSDGLSNEVGTEYIGQILDLVADPTEAARALVQAANDHGGHDNITVVVVDTLIGTNKSATVVAPLIGGLPGRPRVVSGEGAEQIASVAEAPPSRPTTSGLTSAVPRVEPRPPLPAPPRTAPRPMERRSERRRRMGIPRRITPRVLGFFVLVLAVIFAGYAFVRWYATHNYYVTVKSNHLVIYQGRPGGLLGFDPKVVDHTGVATSQILSIRVAALRGDVEEPSLAAAQHYVRTLRNEKKAVLAINNPKTTSTTTPVNPFSTTSTSTTTVVGSPTTTIPFPTTTVSGAT